MSKKTIRLLIISLILIVISGSVFGFMAYKVIAEGKRLSEQTSVLESERAQESSYYQLQNLAKETETERQDLEKLFFLKEDDSVYFLNLVEETALNFGINYKTTDLSKLLVSGDSSEWVVASFVFTGSRDQIFSFLQVLETLPFVIRQTSLELNERSSVLWEANVSLQVRVLSYD